jgi:membrane associated rhomboid family serine protease
VSAPELSVVCKSCGSEVSPYVTECPYCGTRLRKRAPKLERDDDGLHLKEPRRAKARRARRKIPRPGMPGVPRVDLSVSRAYATWLLVLGPAVLLLVTRLLGDPLTDFGAIVQLADAGPLGQPWWHYLASSFVYDDVGYLFVICVAVVLFGSELEQRLGTIATLVLALGCGALGMLGAEGVASVIMSGDDLLIAAGGNGLALGLIAAYAVIRTREGRANGDDMDPIPIAIAATVIFALPLVEDSADVFAAITGALVGGAAGFFAGLGADRRA